MDVELKLDLESRATFEAIAELDVNIDLDVRTSSSEWRQNAGQVAHSPGNARVSKPLASSPRGLS